MLLEKPDWLTSGDPEWNVTRLCMPEATIASALSTVTMFSTPDTSTRAQWPCSTTVLLTPLIDTALSLHVNVRFCPIPATLMLPSAGGTDSVSTGGAGDSGLVSLLGADERVVGRVVNEPPPPETLGLVDGFVRVRVVEVN